MNFSLTVTNSEALFCSNLDRLEVLGDSIFLKVSRNMGNLKL